jgi:hypothetical protein
VRKQLVEEGFEAVLSRKQRATPAVARIFDGEKRRFAGGIAKTSYKRGASGRVGSNASSSKGTYFASINHSCRTFSVS